jgi:hypothetical protein
MNFDIIQTAKVSTKRQAGRRRSRSNIDPGVALDHDRFMLNHCAVYWLLARLNIIVTQSRPRLRFRHSIDISECSNGSAEGGHHAWQ